MQDQVTFLHALTQSHSTVTTQAGSSTRKRPESCGESSDTDPGQHPRPVARPHPQLGNQSTCSTGRYGLAVSYHSAAGAAATQVRCRGDLLVSFRMMG